MTAAASRAVERCPACGVAESLPQAVRGDGVAMRRCASCGSIFLLQVPVDVAGLYRDNYFGLCEDDARSNVDARIGYEASYESSYLDAEFYWAYRIADFVAATLRPEGRTLRCLDVGAATGRLLNVFAQAGYETHGVEFSAPARAIAERRGHAMSSAPAGSLPEHAGRFPVVTALEVIEHVENLDGFFAGIRAAMPEDGVFVGYFPSADPVAFSRGSSYHWLNHSFVHLIYPSEEGIRRVLGRHFGRNVHVCTFLTRQGEDLIPNSIVVAINGDPSSTAGVTLAEMFRQLAYLNDRAWFDVGGPRTVGALGPAWDAAVEAQPDGPAVQIPHVVGVLCAKFGEFGVSRHLRRDGVRLDRLDPQRLADLLVMAMHEGAIDWMRDRLDGIAPGIWMRTIVEECRAIVDRYDEAHPRPPGDGEPREAALGAPAAEPHGADLPPAGVTEATRSTR